MLRALEHQVLEEVGEASLAVPLVLRSDVIPEIDGDEGEPRISANNDVEAVREGQLAEGDRGRPSGGSHAGESP